jgi:SSS family solute:Na+ symporter/sodium/pantothenate symporter
MPTLVVTLANPYVAGILMAAPYGALLSSVSGWLLIISSGLVRDLYQRFLRPAASEKEIERASYVMTVLVGLGVAYAALKPPALLQLIVVFASSGLASAFLIPGVMAAYWRRATAPGAIAALLAGTGVTLGLYLLGMTTPESLGLGWLLPPNPDIGPAKGLRPYYLLGLEPCVWGITASALAGVVVSLATKPPDPIRVSLLFDAQPPSAPAPATLDLQREAV